MKKILLIEDNKDVRENIAEILEIAGYKVEQAVNGKDGAAKAKYLLPDLIICDIMMPELDGYGVLNVLSSETTTASIPFIFLTAKAELTDMRKGMNMGADDYLTKPFEDADLLKAIEVRLGKVSAIQTDFQKSIEGIETFIETAITLDDFDKISKDRKRLVFKKKQPIYSEDNIPRGIYFIEKGSVKTYKTSINDKDYISNIYKAGDFFGYINLLENANYSDNAEALEETITYFIPKDDFYELISKNRMVANTFIKMLAGNVVETQNRMIKLAYNSVRKRVAESLIMLNKTYNTKNETPFTFSVNRQDLASIVGTAAETVIRTLSDFKEEKIIEIKGSAITILDKTKLVNMKN
jgi:CRP-like cAMP-binding protein/CheY-like chemotaxis protein